ncbi:MAG: hypothetical protein M5R40_17155 [Anaerolineae bacterium]|nr:hypothetical protein [Anaerolineae bacterium]
MPHRLEVRARSRDDHLNFCFEAEDVVQIVVPNETDLDATVINEVSGQVAVDGKVKGESVAMHGRGFFEFLT